MDAKKYLLLSYSLKIPLLYDLLNYGTNIRKAIGPLSPPIGSTFNIDQ
jgi:hypothetical protein